MNRQIALARFPQGPATPGDFMLVEAPLPVLQPGEVRVEVEYLSMDPIVRVRMAATSTMGPAVVPGDIVPGRGIGRVVESRAPDLAIGALVLGELGWQALATLPAAALTLLPEGDTPDHHHLNALGPTGLAAYFVTEALFPRAGDTVFIAPAAGAVGSLCAQLALNLGARVVGTGVGPAQLAWLAAHGIEAISPEAEVPAPITVFIDGVGGTLHERVVARLGPRARVMLLGFLADYASEAPPRYGNMAPVLMKRATVTGFLLADHMARADQARQRLASYLASGALKPAQTIWEGLAQAPHAFSALFSAAPPGKQLVRVKEAR